MTVTRIPVGGEHPYDVVVGTGILGELPPLIGPRAVTVMVIAPKGLDEISGPVIRALSDAGYQVHPAEVPAGEVRAAVRAGGGELLRAAEVFDLYEGEQLGEGRKSLALNLEFRADDRTLTDEEVAARREAIKATLDQIGGALRE